MTTNINPFKHLSPMPQKTIVPSVVGLKQIGFNKWELRYRTDGGIIIDRRFKKEQDFINKSVALYKYNDDKALAIHVQFLLHLFSEGKITIKEFETAYEKSVNNKHSWFPRKLEEFTSEQEALNYLNS